MTPRKYLADTNVISSKITFHLRADVARWLSVNANFMRISVVSMGEIERGLLKLEKAAARERDKKQMLRKKHKVMQMRAWQADLTRTYEHQIEPIDLPIAIKWAEISARFPSFRDGDQAIIATAMVKGYGIATRNVKDFRASGVAVVNPFDPSTWEPEDDADPVVLLLR